MTSKITTFYTFGQIIESSILRVPHGTVAYSDDASILSTATVPQPTIIFMAKEMINTQLPTTLNI